MQHESASVLDAEVVDSLRALGEGDAEFFPDLMATYLEQSFSNVQELKLALAVADRKLFRRAVHTLAGASLNIGARPLAHVCRTIEKEIDREEAPNAEQIDAIEMELRKVEREISLQPELRNCGRAA